MRFWARLIIILICTLFLENGNSASIQSVRVWEGPLQTRVVFELDQSIDYQLFALKQPDRIVLDLEQTRFKSSFPDVEKEGLLKGFRQGKRNTNDLRIVLDLNQHIRPKSFLLKPNAQYPYRLVLDLETIAKPIAQPIKSDKPVLKNADQARDVIIAVDAGHGGEDPGAIGASGLYEKKVTLSISKHLVEQINAEKGMKAFLVRKGDYYIPLKKRYQIARDQGADLFISIHADAFYKRSVKGSSVFILSSKGATSEAAKWLAKKENDADLIGGVSLENKDNVLASVLLDLSQSATHEASVDVAAGVLDAIGKVNALHNGRVERANFVVLRSPDMPSILVEAAFISNPTEEKKLKSDRHQRKLAQAIVKGTRQYFGKRPPVGTWFAQRRNLKSHTVSRGDTLSGIASRYNVSLSNLKKTNQLKSDRLLIGTILTIPSAG